MIQQKQRLHRSSDERLLFGVAGGQAEFFDVDPVLVRLGWILLTLATLGIAALAYIVLAVITPKSMQPESLEEETVNDCSSDISESAADASVSEASSKWYTARNVFGAGLIVIGAIILLQNLGLFGAIRWDIVWPVAVVALGLVVLLPSIRR